MSLRFRSCPSTRNSKSSSFSPVRAKPRASKTETGMGTRLELTRTTSVESISALESVVDGLPGSVTGVLVGSATGPGDDFGFLVVDFSSGPLRRPDCDVTLIAATPVSRQANKKIARDERIEVSRTVCRAIKLPLSALFVDFPEAKRPIPSRPFLLAVDADLAFA